MGFCLAFVAAPAAMDRPAKKLDQRAVYALEPVHAPRGSKKEESNVFGGADDGSVKDGRGGGRPRSQAGGAGKAGGIWRTERMLQTLADIQNPSDLPGPLRGQVC